MPPGAIPQFDLEHILSPTPSETFFRETWETKSLHVERDDESHYAGLLSLRDVDQMIAFSRPKFADLSAFHEGAPQGSTYVRGLLADQPSLAPPTNPGIAELRQVFDQGKSVVIMGMQQRWPAVAELCRNLEVVFHCPVHANMYLTPAGSQGFSAHYDPHEVFILQLEGAKHWRLYDRTELLPLASDKSGAPEFPLGAARDVCLQPGDLLYIPRGHVHDAFTTDTFSLHLTVGINVYRWADLLHHAVTCASRKAAPLRESIPGGALPARGLAGGDFGLKQQFKQLLASLSDGDCDRLFDEAAGSLADQFFGQLPMLPGTQFSSQVDLEQVRLDTVLEKHPQAICRVVEKEGGVAIEFPGNRIGGPQRIAAALRFIADTVCFAVQDLPGELNAQAKVVLARRLVREGLLTPVAQSLTAQPAGKKAAQESLTRETTTIQSHVRPETAGRTSERRAPVPARETYEREVVES
jgi:hypothetical protein